ncbi:MAG: peptide deformylase [Syntrophomonadaceae bacterium]|nr:peptide deformylase [Bacillota bacterium]NLM88715.1 peptide deformylase [Syntrophomonadaceae bacterium]HQA49394.1 peptide deformylase [Syntrophomonadaceae bacterium]HQD90252.1 peptide deformylase [Syntrophomonadaceae bacterium]
MGVYQIIEEPDEVLRATALPVKNINAGVLRVLDNMRDTLYAFDGVGLAAPQIGVSKRIIVVDSGDQLIELINPEIVLAEGEQVGKEGCLSIPNVVGTVKRANRVVVRGLNRDGQPVEYDATELLARAFQHEIDHLNGILFIDKATELRRVKP